MKITTVSNYINHHQIPLSDALYSRLGADYHFIQTEPMEEERVQMGWGSMLSKLPYLCRFYEQEKECQRLIAESDIVLFGGVEEEGYLEERLREGKLVIRSSERLYREGQWKAVSPQGLIKKYHDHTRYRNAPVYLLCNGAYVASDFHIVRAYPGKMFKWGYFPQTKHYDLDKLMEQKSAKVTEIVWAGRMLTLKHPEYALQLASGFQRDHIRAHITMAGGGAMEDELQTVIRKEKLQDFITITGFLSPEAVRSYMEKANLCIATSNYREGWGAVINEAMNSGCAVVASHAMGAVPFLLREGCNGLIYKNECFEQLRSCVRELIADKEKQISMGREAYRTIVTQWNAEEASKRLLALCEGLLRGEAPFFEAEGPLSRAPVIPPRSMYGYLKKQGMKRR